MSTLVRPFAARDYFELPEEGTRYQLLDGDLYMSPSPNTEHQRILLNLYDLLAPATRQRKHGQLFVAPFDVQLSDYDVVQPDLCWFSPDREGCIGAQGADGAPDLVIEIVSPATADRDRGLKRRLYARAEVRELWLVDPDKRLLTVYRVRRECREPCGDTTS